MFYDISTFVDYLMPDHVIYKNCKCSFAHSCYLALIILSNIFRLFAHSKMVSSIAIYH